MLDALTRNFYLILHLLSLSQNFNLFWNKSRQQFWILIVSEPFFWSISFLDTWSYIAKSPKILMYAKPIYLMIVNKWGQHCNFFTTLFYISGSNKNVIYCFCIFSASCYYCYLSLFIWEITEILNRFTGLHKLSWDSGILLDFSFIFLNLSFERKW